MPLSDLQVRLHPRTVVLYGDFSLKVRCIDRDRWEVLGHRCQATRDKRRTLANPATYVKAVTSFKLLRWEARSKEASSLRANLVFKCRWSQSIKIYIFVFICNIVNATCEHAVIKVVFLFVCLFLRKSLGPKVNIKLQLCTSVTLMNWLSGSASICLAHWSILILFKMALYCTNLLPMCQQNHRWLLCRWSNRSAIAALENWNFPFAESNRLYVLV